MSGAFGQWQNDRGYELIGSTAARPSATMEIISQRTRHPIHESGYNVPACAVRIIKKSLGIETLREGSPCRLPNIMEI